MHVDYTPEQKALRAEIRAYFSELITPEVRSDLKGMEGGTRYREIIGRMGADGWLGVGWPKEYGGQGRSLMEQHIFYETIWSRRAPFPVLTLNSVAPRS